MSPGQALEKSKTIGTENPGVNSRERLLARIPVSWAWTTMGEIADVFRGASPRPKGDPRYFGGSIPWIMISDITRQPGKYLFSTKECVTTAGAALSRCVPAGSLILSNSGTVCVPKILAVEGCIHDGFVSFSGLEKYVSLDFAYWWFEYVRDQIVQENRQGITQVNLNTAIVREIHFPIVPVKEQQRIVAEIEKQFTRLDDAITALNRARANLKRYRASVLKAACEGRLVPTEAELARKEGRDYEPASELLKRILAERRAKWEADQLHKMNAAGKLPKNDEWKKKYKEPQPPKTRNLPELPEAWAWTTIEAIAEPKLGKMLSKAAFDSDLIQRPYLRNENVQWGRININDIKQMGFAPAEMERFSVKPGDLMVCEGGEAGRAAVYEGPPEMFQYQKALHRIRTYGSLTNTDYLQVYFAHFVPSGSLIPRRSETTIQHLPLEVLQVLPVPLPPQAEQNRLTAELSRVFSLIENESRCVQSELQHEKRLRQSILKHAFTGKLVPQNPNDEPASVLLERIRTERTNSNTPNNDKKRVAQPPSAVGKRARGARGLPFAFQSQLETRKKPDIQQTQLSQNSDNARSDKRRRRAKAGKAV